MKLSGAKILSSDVKYIVSRLSELTGSWNSVELYTPSNFTYEKKKFLERYRNGEIYNPSFRYEQIEKIEVVEIRQELFKLLSDIEILKPTSRLENIVKAALHVKIQDDIATADLVDAVRNREEAKIKEAFCKKYPGTDDLIIEKAGEIYEELARGQSKINSQSEGILSKEERLYLKNLRFDASAISRAFEWVMDRYTLPDGRSMLKSAINPYGFDIKIDEAATAIDVRDKSKKGPAVFIPASRIANGEQLLQLIAHEIEGHARQSINGQEFFGIGGGALKIDNEVLYEGLAMRYEEDIAQNLFGDEFPAPLPYYTFAIKAAEEGRSFYQIFAEQVNKRLHVLLKIHPDQDLPRKNNIDDEIYETAMNRSWIVTFRVMRGHIDASNVEGFAMSKDLAYLRGWLIDKNLRDNRLGYINESAIMAPKILLLMTEFDFREKDLPLPFKNLTRQYWELILKPQFLAIK